MDEQFESTTPAEQFELPTVTATLTPEQIAAAEAQHQRELALYAELDKHAANLSVSSLQFGWIASELWNTVQEDFMEMAKGKEKKALTAFINHVQERESTHIDARKTVVDRFRVARAITRSVYGAIVEGSGGIEPTFHQIRACVFTDKDGNADAEKTDAMIDYAVASNWPSVADIRIYRSKIDPAAPKVDPKQRHKNTLVKVAQSVMVDEGVGTPWYGACKAIVDLMFPPA